MTHPDLERELRDHYRSLDAGSSGRAPSLVAGALDHAPAHRWSFGRFIPARAVLAAGATVAVVAALTVALLPVWHGSSAVTGAGDKSATPAASRTMAASPSAGASQYASGTPSTTSSPNGSPTAVPILSGAEVTYAGKGRSDVLWAVRNSRLDTSADHGRTWHESTLPEGPRPGSTVQDVTVADATHAVVVMTTNPAAGESVPPASTTAAIYVTNDGGATWQTAVSRTLAGNVLAQLIFADARVGFAILTPQTNSGPSASTVLRTLDGGATWAVTGTSAVLGYAVWATDENTIWVDSGAMPSTVPPLRVSRDGGATWSSVLLPGLGDTSSLAVGLMSTTFGGPKFLSADQGYLAVLKQTGTDFETLYYRTLNGGSTWSLMATVPRMVLSCPAFVDATHWYQIAADSASMEATADGGRTWTTVGKLPGAKVFEIYMTDVQNGVALGTGDSSSGWLLYLTMDGGKTWQPADFTAR